MATEKQNAANQANSQQSTGPKTEEGKDASKRNSYKTGMYSMGFVLPEHLETEILETFDWIYSKINPENHIEHEMTMALAHHLVSHREAVREHIHHKLKVAQRAFLCWDDDRKLVAATIGDDLAKRPVTIALQLSSSKHGCAFLLDLWAQLGAVLEANGDWDDAQKAKAYDLLGIDPAMRGPGGRLDVPSGPDPKPQLQAVYLGEVARLTARRDGPLHDVDETERQQALLGTRDDDPIRNEILRRSNQHLNMILKLIKKFEVSLGRVGLAARLGFPKRVVGESKDDFNDRVADRQQQKNLHDAEVLAAANAKRLRANEDAQEAERTVQPVYAAGMDLEAFIAKIREWHERIHGPNAEPVPLPDWLLALRDSLVDALAADDDESCDHDDRQDE